MLCKSQRVFLKNGYSWASASETLKQQDCVEVTNVHLSKNLSWFSWRWLKSHFTTDTRTRHSYGGGGGQRSLQLQGEGKTRTRFAATVSGNANWSSHWGKSVEVPQKVKLEPPYQPLIALLSVYPPKIQKHKSKGYMHPYIYSSIYNSRIIEVSNCPLTDEWVNKLRHLPRKE